MTLTLWRDNRLPSLTDAITANGVAVNLTGSTVKLKLRPEGSAALKVDAAAVVVSAVAGTVRYDWVAADVDTVGSYIGWWEVTTSTKTQDTPEFDIDIVEHAPASISVPNPVGAGGATTIYQGDAYLNVDSRALQYELSVMDAPDLTGLAVVFRIANKLVKTATVVGEDAVRVDLTSTETTALGTGVFQFELVATVSVGNTVTLLRSTITVLEDMV